MNSKSERDELADSIGERLAISFEERIEGEGGDGRKPERACRGAQEVGGVVHQVVEGCGTSALVCCISVGAGCVVQWVVTGGRRARAGWPGARYHAAVLIWVCWDGQHEFWIRVGVMRWAWGGLGAEFRCWVGLEKRRGCDQME